MEGTEPQNVNRNFDRLVSQVWELTDQSCCNTDVAPSKLHIFGALKQQRDSKIFTTDANVNQDVAFCLQTQDTIFSHTGIQASVPWLNKYLIPVVTTESSDTYHLLCVHKRQNQFLGSSFSVTLILETTTTVRQAVTSTKIVKIFSIEV